MDEKKERLEIMTCALLSRCAGLFSQEAIGNEIMDFTNRISLLYYNPNNIHSTAKMKTILEKYQGKLDYLTKAIEIAKPLLPEEMVDILNESQSLLMEMILDIQIIIELTEVK